MQFGLEESSFKAFGIIFHDKLKEKVSLHHGCFVLWPKTSDSSLPSSTFPVFSILGRAFLLGCIQQS
jgi:hypothetical protein